MLRTPPPESLLRLVNLNTPLPFSSVPETKNLVGMNRIYTNITGQHIPRKSGFVAGTEKQSDVLVRIWSLIVWFVCFPIFDHVMLR